MALQSTTSTNTIDITEEQTFMRICTKEYHTKKTYPDPNQVFKKIGMQEKHIYFMYFSL